MVVVGVIALWTVIGAAAFWLFRTHLAHQQTYERFADGTGNRGNTGEDLAAGVASEFSAANQTRRLARRWFWVPWMLGIAIAITLWLVFGWPIQYIIAIGAVVSLLLSQLESFLHNRHVAKLERQLADSIDIMVGAVSAGAALGPAMDAATLETSRPLKPYLQEISGRIRLGDEPAAVFRSLSDRVPLETFLLFASSLAVHHEVGGRLAPTLATVGRTIRDRIEISRRIRSNIAQSQFSTFAILGLIYLIAVIVWRNNPGPMYDFVTSNIGSWFVAGSITMQAVGIVWMNLISRPRF